MSVIPSSKAVSLLRSIIHLCRSSVVVVVTSCRGLWEAHSPWWLLLWLGLGLRRLRLFLLLLLLLLLLLGAFRFLGLLMIEFYVGPVTCSFFIVELQPVVYTVERCRFGTELGALAFVASLGLWRSGRQYYSGALAEILL